MPVLVCTARANRNGILLAFSLLAVGVLAAPAGEQRIAEGPEERRPSEQEHCDEGVCAREEVGGGAEEAVGKHQRQHAAVAKRRQGGDVASRWRADLLGPAEQQRHDPEAQDDLDEGAER